MASAIYFDGMTAHDRPVTLSIVLDRLQLQGPEVDTKSWSLASLRPVERYVKRRPLRFTNYAQPSARVILHDERMIAELLRLAPQLKGGLSAKVLKQATLWTAGTLLVVGMIGYVLVQFAPQRLAFMMPDSWRDRVGSQVETALTDGAKACTSPGGAAALAAMAARLAEGTPDLPPLRITVYNVPVMNAFAMPGDRIVITRELIRRSTRPEQVAGVLAHEIGHSLKRHPEASIVRATGLEVLVGILTGGNSNIATAASLVTILTYSRGAESEADQVAVDLMTNAAIDPMGLKEFFEIILGEEGEPSSGAWKRIGSALSTHPGTAERISRIKPLPPDIEAKPVLDETQWQALRGICS